MLYNIIVVRISSLLTPQCVHRRSDHRLCACGKDEHMNTSMSYIIAIFGLILTGLNIIDRVVQFKKAVNAPEQKQNERIEACETKLILHDAKLEKFQEYLSNDDKRIKSIQDTNKIFAKSLLALLSNDTTERENMYKNLHEYLVNHMDNTMY